MKQAIVIGAGLGGLASASLLAKRGYRVSVFEKNSSEGGKMQQIWSDGYRFDTGPTLFTMPYLLEKLFSKCGYSLNEYLEYNSLNPLCRYFYSDGVIFDSFSEREKALEQIKSFAPEDADAYIRFLKRSEEIYNHTSDAFIYNPLYGIRDIARLNVREFLDIDAFTTVSDKVDEFVSSDYLRKFFKRFATYNGSSPYQAPATLNVIPHIEINQGGYYVNGGMYNIARAMRILAERMGVTFHFNKGVQSVITRKKRATGVLLETGTEVSCDILFSNADASETLLNLLPERSVSKSRKEKQKQIEPSCSGFVLLLGCRKKWPHLKHHNIFFSDDYRIEFNEIFEHYMLPSDPTIYVANTSVTEPDHAPPGSSNLFVLVNAPYLHESQNWSEMVPNYKEKIINILESKGLEGLGDSIEFTKTITPTDFFKLYNSNRGSIYGTSSNNKTAAFARPRNKFGQMKNVYLVGGSTHPGGGIPLVIQSALNAVEILDRYS
ncbi:MAG: phytoene desaturase [Balneolaceae bacterium]|nr:phytoene desaturase [Balneolaceae bacterium]